MLAYFVRHGESETNVSEDFPDDDLKSPHLTLRARNRLQKLGRCYLK
jgi:broad specificity phosphatase PhoE